MAMIGAIQGLGNVVPAWQCGANRRLGKVVPASGLAKLVSIWIA
jgi:hypothetical protein